MKKEYLDVLTNVIGAVESGGQIYGNRRYDAYAGAGANSSNEKTCTLGWAQNYGNEGRRLCQMIFDKSPTVFRKADTAGIESKLSVDWVASGWNPSATERASLIAIITTDAGKECQDELFQELMERYIKEAVAFGVSGIRAQMMWCEIEHLGGSGPVKRIFGRAKQPYTPDSIFDSLILDQNDTRNDNQVGDKKFQKRHECCVSWIKQYVNEEEEKTMSKTAQDYLNVFRGWIGYNESNGLHKKIIDLYNSVKPLPRGYAVKYNDEWCDTTISAAGIAADVVELIGRECGCEEHIKIFKSLGIWNEDGTITPEPGYIILYNWDQSTQPNDGYADHIGVVEAVSGGQITCIEGNKNEAVARRVLSVGNGYIRGYASPKFAKSSGSSGSSVTIPTTPSTSEDISKTVAWKGVVNTATLNIRTWAGADNAQLKSYPTIAQGTEVGVCDVVNDKSGEPWYYVKITGSQGEKFGFVSAMYITKQSESIPSSGATTNSGGISKNPQWVGRVTADALNVRTWAGVNNPTIKSWPKLANGNMVDVCDTVNAADGSPWYYIRIDGRIFGFVHSAYIEKA